MSAHLNRLYSWLHRRRIAVELVDESRDMGENIYNLRSMRIGPYLSRVRRCNIAHIQSSQHIFRWFHLVACRLLGLHVVVTIHSWRANGLVTALNRFFLRLAHRIIVVNEAIGVRLKLPAYDVIPAFLPPLHRNDELPVHVRRFIDSARARGDSLLCANASKLTKYRGQDLYGLDLCVELVDNLVCRSDVNAALVFVISSPAANNPLYISARELIAERGLEERVCLYNEPLDFVTLMMCCDVVLRPTTSDGDALTVREALYLGLPVVASDCAKRPEGTILFRNRDAADFTARTMAALKGRTKARRASPGNDDNAHFFRYVDLYREVLNSSGLCTSLGERVKEMMVYVESADYAGYDPFDALNSPLIRRIGAKSKWVRIGATQILRRCPFNVRPILAIRPGHNPKALGLFLWGYARLFAAEKNSAYLDRIDHLLDLLESSKSKGYSGNCWGYNFDWQNRKMWTPRYTPTIVNSAFIGHALLDAYFLGRVGRALDMAVGIKDFICSDLARYEEEDRLCFSYTPLNDGTYVHNANLLGASLLIRLYRICGDKSLEELALASLRYALHHQRKDGAWYYGDMKLMHWVDSFHTGFNLQALQYFIRAGYGPQCRHQHDLGLQYYAEHFFLPDGAAKYYDNRVFPIDIHSLCQAVVVLSDSLAGQSELSERVLRWMLRHMWDAKGYFYFRKGRLHVNKIPYMRWSQAWAFHALTSYLYNKTQMASRN